MLRTLISFAILARTTATVRAANLDAYSANFMLPYCKDYLSGSSTLDAGFCAGVVEGIGHMAAMLEMSSSPGAGPPLCVPNGVTRGQTVRAVVSYIEARPKRMDEPFWQLTFEALLDAWPCKPQPTRPSGRAAAG
jgi:Rap1a immunity proteins